jgi:hypothetical protein
MTAMRVLPWVVQICILANALQVAGCASTTMTVDALLAEGKKNRLKAHNEHEGERLTVRGTVAAVTLREKTHAQGVETPFAWSGGDWEVHRVTRVYGLLILAPTEAEHGRLFCLFEPDSRDELEALGRGDVATVSGDYSMYRDTAGGLVVHLSHCQLER